VLALQFHLEAGAEIDSWLTGRGWRRRTEAMEMSAGPREVRGAVVEDRLGLTLESSPPSEPPGLIWSRIDFARRWEDLGAGHNDSGGVDRRTGRSRCAGRSTALR